MPSHLRPRPGIASSVGRLSIGRLVGSQCNFDQTWVLRRWRRSAAGRQRRGRGGAPGLRAAVGRAREAERPRLGRSCAPRAPRYSATSAPAKSARSVVRLVRRRSSMRIDAVSPANTGVATPAYLGALHTVSSPPSSFIYHRDDERHASHQNVRFVRSDGDGGLEGGEGNEDVQANAGHG